jgi:hypothetical protein
VIQRRELPPLFGPSPNGKWTFVASTTSSRRPRNAFPTISSDSPVEYMSAVSTKLMPASSAAWMIRTLSSWSVLPMAPNIIVPRQWTLTSMPVPPSTRYRKKSSPGLVYDGIGWSSLQVKRYGEK